MSTAVAEELSLISVHEGDDNADPIAEIDAIEAAAEGGDGTPPPEAVATATPDPEPEPDPIPTVSAVPPPRTPQDYQIDSLIAVNNQIARQRKIVDDLAAELKTEKKELESLQDQLSGQVTRLEMGRRDAVPDPARYPLLDKPREATEADRAEIASKFPPPESIPPVGDTEPETEPAAGLTLDQYRAERAGEAKLADLKLKKPLLAKLQGAGLVTLADLIAQRDGRGEFADPGLTPNQEEFVQEYLEAFDAEVVAHYETETQVEPHAHCESCGKGLRAGDDHGMTTDEVYLCGECGKGLDATPEEIAAAGLDDSETIAD